MVAVSHRVLPVVLTALLHMLIIYLKGLQVELLINQATASSIVVSTIVHRICLLPCKQTCILLLHIFSHATEGKVL